MNTAPPGHAIVVLAGFLLCACADSEAGGEHVFSDSLDDAAMAELSRAAVEKVGDGIGKAEEARFSDAGEYVVVLDEYSPHLRLFTAAGDPLWAGGREGGGPSELKDPLSIAVAGSDIFVVQPGRISEWRIESDTVAFERSRPIPSQYFPFGLETACGEGLLLYARNDRQYRAPPDSFAGMPRIEFLHEAILAGDSVVIRPLWEDDRSKDLVPVLGHEAAMIGRTGRQVAMLHRINYLEPGEILELGCDGAPIRRIPEMALVTGDSLPVLVSRKSAMQWTSGIAAIPGGFVVALDKYFSRFAHDVPESYWTTEIFRFVDGQPRGSTLLRGQWRVMDYLPARGLLLVGTGDPVPHFVIAPSHWIIPSTDGEAQGPDQ